MVNICIPNYNKGELVHHALSSLLRQTTPAWRAVVVDDASTDGSWEIIQKYAARDPRITAVRNETNRGGNYSRNLAARLGRDAKYLIFLDSDDWLEDDCIENRVREFENGQHEDDDFLVFHLRTVSVHDGEERVSRDSWYKAGRDLDLSMLNHTYGWQTMTLIWRRTSFERLGGFDESLPRLQDVEFHARAVLEHAKFSYAERQTADCRFFAGAARRTTSCAKGLKNFTDAAELFVAKMRALIDAKGERLALRHAALSTMSLVVVRQVGDAYQAGEISKDERNQLIAHIQAQPHLGGKIACFYARLYALGVNKIKGFNFAFACLARLVWVGRLLLAR
jgi:glycosyltransferase involved in cell wall biosynthesis